MKLNNNIENQFREKLNQRTIEPSDKAWDRLDAMLSVSEKKKPKRGWLWMAASLILFASIGSLFLRTENPEVITNDELQITNYELQNVNPTKPITNDEIITDHTSEIVIKEEKTIPQDSFRIVQNPGLFNSNDNISNKDTEIAITDLETEIETNTYVTAQELLNDIENKQHITEKPKKTSVSINHKSLLYQAEMEVESQYRNKAFDRFLQRKYDDARMAVINKF